MQEDNGSSVYIRLTTRNLVQFKRKLISNFEKEIISGGYWLHKPSTKSRCHYSI